MKLTIACIEILLAAESHEDGKLLPQVVNEAGMRKGEKMAVIEILLDNGLLGKHASHDGDAALRVTKKGRKDLARAKERIVADMKDALPGIEEAIAGLLGGIAKQLDAEKAKAEKADGPADRGGVNFDPTRN